MLHLYIYMCFLTGLAKRINLFGRDSSLLTRVDVCLTYICIMASITIISVYAHKYYQLADNHIEECEQTRNQRDCIQSEFIHLIVPFVGILYGFLNTVYKACDLLSIFINYFCCCYSCCCQQENPNMTTIELTKNPTAI